MEIKRKEREKKERKIIGKEKKADLVLAERSPFLSFSSLIK